MTFLLANWKYLLIAIMTAVIIGAVYHAGGNAPRAELAAIHAVAEAEIKHVKAVEVKQQEVVQNVTTQTHSAVAASDAYYRLRLPAGSGSVSGVAAAPFGTINTTSPVTPDTGRCSESDGSADAIQVLMLQRFYEGIRKSQQ